MIKQQKRQTTLIEILIAMALTVLVLTTLMFFYREVGIIGGEIDKVKSQDFYMRYVESRLADILPKVVATNEKDYVFFSVGDEGLTKPGSQSLIFTFNNGVSRDKNISGTALARIFLDPQGGLTIAYWSSPQRWEKSGVPPLKKEVLLEKVESLAFEFFVSPENNQPDNKKNQSKQPSVEIVPKGDWRVQPWSVDFKEMPVMVKVIIKVEGSKVPLTFVFPLANNSSHIVYE